MNVVNKVIDWIEDYLLVILMIAMTVTVMAQIILRIVGGDLKWTEETARYMFAWVIYLGASRSVRDHAELSIDMVRGFFKDGTRVLAIYDTVRTVLCITFAAVFARYGIALLQNMVVRPQYSPACQYNMIIVYASSLVASILMIIRYVQELVGNIKNIIAPHKSANKEAGETE